MWREHIRNIKLPDWLRENKQVQKALALCAGFLGVNLVLFVVVAGPSAARLRTLEAAYAELRKQQADAVLFEKQRSLFSGLSAGMPTQKDMPLLVKMVVQTARARGLKVGVVNFDIPKQGSEGIMMLTIPFSTEGTYPSVKRFIFDMESSDRFVGIQDLKLTSGQGGVKADMKLITYIKGR